MSFLKGLGKIIAMLLGISVLAQLNPTISAFACLGVLLTGMFSLFRPIPKIGFGSRVFSLSAALIVGFLGLAISGSTISANENDAKLAELKSGTPSAGSSEFEKTDGRKSRQELKTLVPQREAEEKSVSGGADEAATSTLTKQETGLNTAETQNSELYWKQKAAEDKILGYVQFLQWPEAKHALATTDVTGKNLADLRDTVEGPALKLVKALPTSSMSDLRANKEGYEFLTALRPDNRTYAEKAKYYADKISSLRRGAIHKLRRKIDKVEGVAFYQHPNQPKYLNSRSTAYLYIGQDISGGSPWLRMKVQYTASDWLFVNTVYAWHDGIKELLIAGSFERDNNSTIWEWKDVSPSPHQIEVLKSLAEAKESILRFEGDQYHRDVTLSGRDKNALRDVLLAYDVMNSDG